MGTSVIIAALPAVDERVNKLSSETAAHMTLLFLGEDPDNLDAIVEYVEHAAKELSPFYMPVDYRGTLGEDEADVLFFEDNRWDGARIKEFRHHLLLNDAIKKAYDSNEQFDGWTPHLTMGYPESPAHEDTSDYPGIHGVQFDRIAVWTSDSEGPEFRLKYADTMAEEVNSVAMSTEDLGALAAAAIFGHDPDAVEHFGVKGMKWGVRKSDSGGGSGSAPKERGKIRRGITKANTALDAGAKVIDKGEKKLIFLPHEKRVEAASATQSRILGEARAINKDPRFKGKDLKRDPALKEAYFKEVEKRAVDIYKEELTNARVRFAADTVHAILSPKKDRVDVTGPADSLRHADEDLVLASFVFEFDDLGQIVGVTVPEESLMHYGVKGMRWGIRKDERTSRGGADKGPTAAVVTQKKPGQFAKTSGGERHPLHEDAAKSLAARQKARKSTTDALSNAELKAAVERMQLEQRYSQLEFSSDRRSRGARFIAGFFGKKKPTKFKDMDEEYGAQSADAVKKALAARAAMKAAKVAATAAA